MSDKSENPDDIDSVETVRRAWLTEDWASVVVGLALIVAVLVGVLPGGLIP